MRPNHSGPQAGPFAPRTHASRYSAARRRRPEGWEWDRVWLCRMVELDLFPDDTYLHMELGDWRIERVERLEDEGLLITVEEIE